MNTGTLQRRWQEDKPQVYDKENRYVYLDIKEETRADEDGKEKKGWSFIQIQIDRHIDYGHIKSQLIEAGFAQKDEFGLLMNAMERIIITLQGATKFGDTAQGMNDADIKAFMEFAEWRAMCAEAAKEVMKHY